LGSDVRLCPALRHKTRYVLQEYSRHPSTQDKANTAISGLYGSLFRNILVVGIRIASMANCCGDLFLKVLNLSYRTRSQAGHVSKGQSRTHHHTVFTILCCMVWERILFVLSDGPRPASSFLVRSTFNEPNLNQRLCLAFLRNISKCLW
jgi:hypothetical protein